MDKPAKNRRQRAHDGRLFWKDERGIVDPFLAEMLEEAKRAHQEAVEAYRAYPMMDALKGRIAYWRNAIAAIRWLQRRATQNIRYLPRRYEGESIPYERF